MDGWMAQISSEDGVIEVGVTGVQERTLGYA